jgi:hypothetical protein
VETIVGSGVSVVTDGAAASASFASALYTTLSTDNGILFVSEGASGIIRAVALASGSVWCSSPPPHHHPPLSFVRSFFTFVPSYPSRWQWWWRRWGDSGGTKDVAPTRASSRVIAFAHSRVSRRRISMAACCGIAGSVSTLAVVHAAYGIAVVPPTTPMGTDTLYVAAGTSIYAISATTGGCSATASLTHMLIFFAGVPFDVD